jgi:ABC-type phosphate transport system substrate-binding protein
MRDGTRGGSYTVKKKLIASATAGAALLSLAVAPTGASAGADSTQRVLGLAGSDTTYFVMEALANSYNTNARYNPDRDKVINVPPLHAANASVEAGEATSPAVAWLSAARTSWPGGAVMPADDDCKEQFVFGGVGSFDADGNGNLTGGSDKGSTTVEIDVNGNTVVGEAGVPGEKIRLGVLAPNGSGSGQNAGKGTAVNGTTYPLGCIDMVRSSSAPGAGNRPNFETWAFALDAIGWTYFPGNPHGVAARGLAQADLKNIYQCYTGTKIDNGTPGVIDVGDRFPGYPIWSTWGEVNGDPNDNTPIRAYRVQPGSGTGNDVASTLIGVSNGQDASFLTNCDGFNNIDIDGNPNTSFAFPIVQEHDCRAVADVDKPDAICFYGFSRWQLQARSLEADKRNGTVFGKFRISGATAKRPSFSNINETAARYEGTRYVYNLVTLNHDGAGEDAPGTTDARTFIGVNKQPAACNVPAATVDETVVNEDCNFDGDKLDRAVPVGGVGGFLCDSPLARKIIATFGMKPLPRALTDATDSDYGQSSCRRNKYSL